MNALLRATSVPWMIEPAALKVILAVADRAEPDEAGIKMLAARDGRRMEGHDATRLREGGVAVIPIVGPVFRHADMFTEMCAVATTERLAADFSRALADPNVRSIVLDVSCPGGEVEGTGEFAGMVFAARGVKRVVAYAGGYCTSAAYYWSAAAAEIVADPAAMLGSIGVVVGFRDTSAADEKKGIRDIEIVSSQSPRKRLDGTTDAGRDAWQEIVDATAEVFVADVARFRGVTPEKVLDDFGRGGMLVGRAAVAAGLADRLGSLEQVIAELAANPTGAAPRGPNVRNGHAAAKGDRPMSEENRASTAAGDPAEMDRLRQQIADQAKALAETNKANAVLLEKSIAAETSAFIARATSGASPRVLPAERDKLAAAFTQAARDDAAHPLAGGATRTAAIEAAVDARPGHALKQERSVAGGEKVLDDPMASAGDDDDDNPEASARAYAEKRNKLSARTNGKA